MGNRAIIGVTYGRLCATAVFEMHNKTTSANQKSSRIIRFSQLLITYEWLFLLLILPLILFPTPVRALALLLIPALWLARKVGYGYFVPGTPVDWPMFGLLLMVLVSLYATFDMLNSLGKIAGMVYGVAVFYAMVAFVRNDQSRLWRGTALLLGLGIGVVMIGLIGTQWVYKFPLLRDVVGLLPQRLLDLPGAESGFSPNQLAGILLLVAPLALLLAGMVLIRIKALGQQLRPYQTILILVSLMVTALMTGGTLLLTQSRGGLFGFGAGILFVLMVAVRRQSRWVFSIMLLFVTMGIGALTTTMGVEPTVDLLFEQAGLEAGSDQIGTLSGRVAIWSRAFYAIQDFPLTGVGMNNFRRIVPIMYPLFLIPPDVDIAHAHNHLLQAALDLGLPGLVAYFALWLTMAAMLWQTWQQTASFWFRGLALGFAGSLLAYFVFGTIDVVALGAKPGFVFWVLLGLVTALHDLVYDVNGRFNDNDAGSVAAVSRQT